VTKLEEVTPNGAIIVTSPPIITDLLGGGFKHVCIFSPIPGEMIQFDDCAYVSSGLVLVQPPTRNLSCHFFMVTGGLG